MRRAQERREAAEQRRETLRRRRAALLAGTAGAALFAAPAQAAELEVTSTLDGPADACDADCTLRDAITVANGNGEADTITFASTVTGTIRLTQGTLAVGESGQPLEIEGPGADELTLDGDRDDDGPDGDDVRVVLVQQGAADVTLSGLTLTGGTPDAGTLGGRALQAYAPTRLVDMAVTGNSGATSSPGGAVAAVGTRLELLRTTVSGNEGNGGGGVAALPRPNKYPFPPIPVTLVVRDSTISGNTSSGDGAGILSRGATTIERSTITDNEGSGDGGGVAVIGDAGFSLTDSTVSGNTGRDGGGVHLALTTPKYSSSAPAPISGSTISGNTATANGGGVSVEALGNSDLVVSRSTIARNTTPGFGGGIRLSDNGTSDEIGGDVTVEDSTISGNGAATGGGIAVGEPPGTAFEDLTFARSTIAANTATAAGGGIHLSSYDTDDTPPERVVATPAFESTIVADNAAPQGPDLDRSDDATSGGADLAFSLVEAPGDVPLFQAEGIPNRVGTDPQLGPLADNGGTTQTHLPAGTSPVVDQGEAPGSVRTDQRGGARTIDTPVPNAPRGNGTDIGAVEVPASSVPSGSGGGDGGTGTTPVTPQPRPPVATRVRPRGLTVRVTPRRDTRAPFRFRTSGRLLLPTGLTAAEGCQSGVVSVQIKRGPVTLSTRRVRLRRDCTFSSSVVFREARRFGNRRSLRFFVRFLGNNRVLPLRRRAPIVRGVR
jgi:CSLREA domain-containing protein